MSRLAPGGSLPSSPRGSTRPPAPSPLAAASLRSTSTRTPDVMQVAFATQPAPGGAVNEDFITATDKVVILLDGSSVPKAWRLAVATAPLGMSAGSVDGCLPAPPSGTAGPHRR